MAKPMISSYCDTYNWFQSSLRPRISVVVVIMATSLSSTANFRHYDFDTPVLHGRVANIARIRRIFHEHQTSQ